MSALSLRSPNFLACAFGAVVLMVVDALHQQRLWRFAQSVIRKIWYRDSVSRQIGWIPPYAHASLSLESCQKSAEFVPRVDDVFILTAPKTGTTWMQMICHSLRTSGTHTNFEDIYQVVPWDQMCWDLNQNIDDEQVARPRLFKTHKRLASINRGAKYLCLVRNVEKAILSWWRFLKEKDVPPLRQYTSPSQFVFDKGFVAEDMRFGASIWEYYVEFFQCLSLPNVLVLCYEDLVTDLGAHLDLIAGFLGVTKPDQAARSRILDQCSKEWMAKAVSKFDESWAGPELQRIGRCPQPESFLTPASRVHLGTSAERLDDTALAFLENKWWNKIYKKTGLKNYEELRMAVKTEVESRRDSL
eukprot:gnl/MRDRNA2_/MRDRNA2_25707_c0_seq1.p1 gnl/MRDRNA2_/MRDRNA2_25707_c0~~gnl/MRDRNA2_/MRDRNA2_25707_c0_seq1.p1  ORF type:complete len:358 (-),score=43.13 gnl/MRDRNA2_/MRDRNA2_25707_c0_seq1:99-1172(-)